MPGTNLIVPVVLWGKHAPTHCVSSVYLSRDQKTLVTGCYDGQICIWQVNPETLKMTPRCLLVGHTAPVTCLSRASIIQDNNFIVSSSEAGEMCTWDLIDGKCRESVKLSQIHTNIQAYHMCNSDDLRLFCNGYYAEILIMDPFSLEILFSLSSKMNPDWISALHVLRPSSRKDDVVLAISITGTVKVWSLLGHENKQSEPIYENESKQIRCLNALSLNCCAYNQRTVLIVCAKYCQIYDAGDFSVLCSITAPSGERWMSGDFLSPDRILVWSTEGKGYLYKLPANSVPDHKGFHGPTVDHDSPVLLSMLAHPDNKLLSCPPAMRYLITSVGGKQRRLMLRGDSEGVVSIWNVDEANTPVSTFTVPLSVGVAQSWFSLVILMSKMNHALVDLFRDEDDAISEKVEEDRHISSYDIAEKLGLDHKTVLTHLKKARYTKKLETWVPQELAERNLMNRVLICDSLLIHNQTEPFLKTLITDDKKWIIYNKRDIIAPSRSTA
ncbi:WD repeat-containing protein 7 [Eumeta japonica]|uniref:WD repeat-containing protein 7 n=1 Tax=Eumeta variegata TaxID=151549 RepID=A0A4C1ZI01_EUMVA|nr:WD repeat-containing protein 7 [Eumeta japonica]